MNTPLPAAPIASEIVEHPQSPQKTFYLTLQENDRGRLIKLLELLELAGAHRSTILVPLESAPALIAALERLTKVAG